MLDVPFWLWPAFAATVVVAPAVDLLAHRGPQVIGLREAAWWSGVRVRRDPALQRCHLLRDAGDDSTRTRASPFACCAGSCRSATSTPAPASSSGRPASGSPHRCSRSWWRSRPPTSCSPWTACRPCCNRRFVEGRPHHPNQDTRHRARNATGQRPFATIPGCSDSRVAAEIMFDRGLGDLLYARPGTCSAPRYALAAGEVHQIVTTDPSPQPNRRSEPLPDDLWSEGRCAKHVSCIVLVEGVPRSGIRRHHGTFAGARRSQPLSRPQCGRRGRRETSPPPSASSAEGPSRELR